MKLIIFAGGLGTRISEESDYVPKPMVKIGKKPINVPSEGKIVYLN
jgi:glucose-1-phosphate cytidylyltransferase